MCRFGFLEHQLVHLQEVEVLVLIGLVLCAKHLAAQNTLRLAQANPRNLPALPKGRVLGMARHSRRSNSNDGGFPFERHRA